MHLLVQKRGFSERNHHGLEASIAVITHVSVGSMMWFQMAMVVTVVLKVSQKTEWMTDAGVELKEEMAEKKP